MRPAAERAVLLAQHLLPRRTLTRAAGWLARRPSGPLVAAAIRAFVRRYRVALDEAETTDPAGYPDFNAFFTRALAPGARPLAAATLVCPVDGTVSACGRLDGDRLLQAKGHRYTAAALLDDPVLAAGFAGGHYVTLYLSPRDYHRVHMPCAGRLRRMVHVPGELFPVNPLTARQRPGLFARNERVVCVFDAEPGPFALVLVGATVVGSVATPWHGVVRPPRARAPTRWDYDATAPRLQQGEECGRFLLGSTVIGLWPAAPLAFATDWQPGRPVRMGEAMAQRDAGA